MNINNTDYLVKKYPKLFANSDKSPMVSPMAFGMEFADGWYTLMDVLCGMIQRHIDQTPECPQVVFEQTKEKWARLTIYYSGGDEYIQGLVDMAESLSEYACEVCGNPGKVRTGGWWMTLCDVCEGKRYEKYEEKEDK